MELALHELICSGGRDKPDNYGGVYPIPAVPLPSSVNKVRGVVAW